MYSVNNNGHFSAVDDPCTAPPRNPGTGEFHATRWAFDGSSRKCVPFEYRGMKGNSNNFLTRENCEKRCPVFQNPCKIGEPHAVNNQYLQCSPQQVCPGGHYCHIGSEANYCCKALGSLFAVQCFPQIPFIYSKKPN